MQIYHFYFVAVHEIIKFARYANYETMKTDKVLALVAVMLVCCSCDMFRKIAGRPTSDELETRRNEILQEEARIEALKQRRQAQEDSLAIVDSIRRMETDVHSLSEIGDLYTTALDHRYYIVVGSFRDEANAESLLKSASEAGYVPVRINLGKFTAVGLCPTDRLTDAFLSLKSVKREWFCPSDVWILVNR